MTPKEYKALCKTIYRMYKNTLDLSYFDACELCDDVYFGRMTSEQLLESMEEMANDELATTGQ